MMHIDGRTAVLVKSLAPKNWVTGLKSVRKPMSGSIQACQGGQWPISAVSQLFFFLLCFFLSWFPCFSSQKAYISRSFRLAHARPIHRKSAAHTHEQCLNMLLSLWLFLTLSLSPLLEFWCVRSHWLEVFFSTIYSQGSVPYIKVLELFRYITRSIGFILTLILLLCQVTMP